MKVLLESVATVTGSKVTGIALTPTTSLNGNNYLPDVIDNASNVNVLLDNFNWEHTEEKVGTVKFTVDPKTHTMYYEGNILSERKNKVKEGKHKVSIEAHVDEVSKTCSPKVCYNTPMQLKMEGLAITENPSVSTTTMQVIESVEQLEKMLVKEDVDSIVNKVISDQIDSLEEQIILNYELLQLYDQILQVNPDDPYAQDQYFYCLYNLQYLVDRYLDLLEDSENVDESIKTIKLKLESLKEKQIPLKDQISKLRKEKFCEKCNGVKHG